MLLGASLAIQWIRLCASNAGAQGQFLLFRELRSCVLCGTAKNVTTKKAATVDCGTASWKHCFCQKSQVWKNETDGPFLHSLGWRFADHSLLSRFNPQNYMRIFHFILTICPRNRIFPGHILPVRPSAYAWHLPDVDRPYPDGPGKMIFILAADVCGQYQSAIWASICCLKVEKQKEKHKVFSWIATF